MLRVLGFFAGLGFLLWLSWCFVFGCLSFFGFFFFFFFCVFALVFLVYTYGHLTLFFFNDICLLTYQKKKKKKKLLCFTKCTSLLE
jgi:hypothetical protein